MLYIVATPIGNLADITLRALETLRKSDLIACEDTRKTQVLLKHYEIQKPLMAFHEHNEQEKSEDIIELLKQGKTISVVSDAGMPGISDPGSRLIKRLIEEDLEFSVLPGASAFTTALVFSGLDTDSFSFLGFLPVKGMARRNLLEVIEKEPRTLILYEAPHRLDKTMADLMTRIPERKIAIIRELTKIYEEAIRFKIKDYDQQDFVKKGEMVLVIEKAEKEEMDEEIILSKLEEAIKSGMRKSQAAKQVAKDHKLKKNYVYDLAKKLKKTNTQ